MRKKGWGGRWYLWDGGFVTLGRGAGHPVPTHEHHAIQITLGLDAPVLLRRGDEEPWREYRAAVVGADVAHSLNPGSALGGLIWVDPETHEGRWLRRSFPEPIAEIPPGRIDAEAAALAGLWEDPTDPESTARLVYAIVRGLCTGLPPHRALDPRIVRALEVIRQRDTARLSLDEVARAVFLSPSRLAHLFTAEVGLPFRRYLLWRKLTRAMLAVGRGSTLSAAAHLCGFADSAHLTRACVQMFGLSPSVMLASGELYEVPAPFELPSAAA